MPLLVAFSLRAFYLIHQVEELRHTAQPLTHKLNAVRANIVYLGYDFKVRPIQPGVEILIAELGLAGFESFVETEDGVSAYINKADWSEHVLDDIQILNSEEFDISFSFEEIEQTNWNAEWETNFNPILVDDTCYVRAPFHDKINSKYDIMIRSKLKTSMLAVLCTFLMCGCSEDEIYLLESTFTFDEVNTCDLGFGANATRFTSVVNGAPPLPVAPRSREAARRDPPGRARRRHR